MGPGGRVYVTDKGHDRVACFDRDGEFAYALGRRGRGVGAAARGRAALHRDQGIDN